MAKSSTSFKKGHSGNPGGRPRTIVVLQSLAREHTEEAVMQLVDVMRNAKSDRARIVAAASILDRGWGKPAQMVHAEVKEKRSLLDWTTEELLAIIDKSKEASDQDCSEPDEDCGDPAKSDEVSH
jgi:uncharacterized protein DUF5681